MVLRSDRLLDQLDSLLTRMQNQLPSPPTNPDTRPLPYGWVEHFDKGRNIWYYINLGAHKPHATYVHPDDESIYEEDKVSNNTPASSSTSTTQLSSHSHSSSPYSPTVPQVRTRTEHRSSSIGSTLNRQGTAAQQLYATSLRFGSKSPKPPLARRESVSSSKTSPNSEPENSHMVSTPPMRSHTMSYCSPRMDSCSSVGPALSVPPNSHDPRKIFDLTRPSQGTRRYRHDGPSQAVSAPTPSSPLPSCHMASGEPPTRIEIKNSLGLLIDPASVVDISAAIQPDAQALYHPCVASKPSLRSRSVNPQAYPSPTPHSPRTPGVTRKVSGRIKSYQKRPQPILIVDPDHYKPYTAVTEDESLKVVPNPSSVPYLPTSGVTEDDLLIFTSAPTLVHAMSPTINVLDVQNSDSTPLPVQKVETKMPRTNSISRLHIRKKSLTNSNTLVLQQPVPIRPLGGLPAQLNLQISGIDEDGAHYYSESFKGSSKDRKSYGFSSIFEAMDRFTRRDSGIIMKDNV